MRYLTAKKSAKSKPAKNQSLQALFSYLYLLHLYAFLLKLFDFQGGIKYNAYVNLSV